MTGYCSLIIKGETLDFNEIEKSLGLKASKKYTKGKIVSKVIGVNEFDLIRFDKKMIESQSLDRTLELLLNEILPNKEYIKIMQKECEIVLKSFIQSSNAQVRFDITPDNLARISQLGIKLEVSILSWGGADRP